MRHIPYTIYDEYFACAQKMEEAEFNKDYYCKFIGIAEVRRFKNNDVEVRIEKKKCISANGIELYRGSKRFVLRAYGKTFFFKLVKKDTTIFDKFFTRKEKDFFEFNFGEVFVEDKDKFMNKQEYERELEEENEDVDSTSSELDEYLEDRNSLNVYNLSAGYQQLDETETYELTLQQFERAITLEEYEDKVEKQQFELKQYYKKMTENQAKILALWLVGLSNKAISLLMKSSPTYIFLEKERIAAKIRKLIKEKKCR